MVIPGQLIPFICGCLLCLGTLASVFIAIGSGYVKHEDEDSREPKIRKFCEAVDRWQSGGSGYHALPQYRFYLMGPNWVTVPCDLVEHGYEVGFEHDVGSFTDYQCPGYGLRKLRCPRLDLVLGEPTVNTEYNVTLRGESALRSSRHEPPVLVGTVATQIAAQEGRLLPVEHTDDCHDDCAVDKARSLCTNELEGVAYENGEYVRCETLRLIDQPCFVLTCDEDCHLEDASRWKIRPDSRCSGAAHGGYHVQRLPPRSSNAAGTQRRAARHDVVTHTHRRNPMHQLESLSPKFAHLTHTDGDTARNDIKIFVLRKHALHRQTRRTPDLVSSTGGDSGTIQDQTNSQSLMYCLCE